MAVLHKTFIPELERVMGTGHSISDGTASHHLEPCFAIVHSFPDKIAGTLNTLLSRDHRSACTTDTTADKETSIVQLSDPTDKWAAVPYLPTTSSPSSKPVAKSLIESSKPNTTRQLDDDFILMNPKMLSNKPPTLDIIGDVAYPRLRPRTCVPTQMPTERQDFAAQQLNDLDRLLHEETTKSCRDKFIPIRETDDEDSLPDESTGVQQPTVDALKSGDVSSFKLKPRTSRNPWDYKFTW